MDILLFILSAYVVARIALVGLVYIDFLISKKQSK